MKKTIQILLMLTGLGTGVLCWLDATRWIDPATGFPTMGPVWVRYGAGLALFLLAAAASTLSVRHFSVMAKRSKSAAAAAMGSGVLCAVIGAFRLAKAFPNLQALVAAGKAIEGEGFQWYLVNFIQNCGGDTLMGVFALFFAWTMISQSVYWCVKSPGEYPSGGVYCAMSGILYLGGVAFERFLMNTSSVYRVYHVWQLLSIMLAVLFMLSLLRVTFFPETNREKSCTRNGLACFYGCTCCDAVFTMALWRMGGQVTMGNLLTSLLLGMIGLLGLAVAIRLIDPDQKFAEEDEPEQEEEYLD